MKMKGGEVATCQVGVGNHAWGWWVSGGEVHICKTLLLCFVFGFGSCDRNQIWDNAYNS